MPGPKTANQRPKNRRVRVSDKASNPERFAYWRNKRREEIKRRLAKLVKRGGRAKKREALKRALASVS